MFKEDPMANQLIMSYCVELQGVAKAEGTSTQANQVSAKQQKPSFHFLTFSRFSNARNPRKNWQSPITGETPSSC